MRRKLWEKLVNPAAMKREDYSNMRSVNVGSPAVLGAMIGPNHHITTQPINKAVYQNIHFFQHRDGHRELKCELNHVKE